MLRVQRDDKVSSEDALRSPSSCRGASGLGCEPVTGEGRGVRTPATGAFLTLIITLSGALHKKGQTERDLPDLILREPNDEAQ